MRVFLLIAFLASSVAEGNSGYIESVEPALITSDKIIEFDATIDGEKSQITVKGYKFWLPVIEVKNSFETKKEAEKFLTQLVCEGFDRNQKRILTANLNVLTFKKTFELPEDYKGYFLHVSVDFQGNQLIVDCPVFK